MARDEFFGTRIAERKIGSYHLSLRDYAEHAELPPHRHSGAFATIVVSGGLREESARGAVDCATHHLIVHAPEERHRNRFGRKTQCLSIEGGSFTRTACLRSASETGIAAKLIREFRHTDALSPLAVEALMLELFVASERLHDDDRAPRWLEAVHDLISERFFEPLTLADLASRVDVHPGHIARAVRRHYGKTVGEMVRERRLDYARERLMSTAPLQAIAHDAGFADQSHFTRTFRRATGMTPTQYRHMLRTF